MLDQANLELKTELQKYITLYQQEKAEKETLRQELEQRTIQARATQTELEGIRQNRDMVRELLKDLEKENRALKNQLQEVKSSADEFEAQLNSTKQREESAKKSLQLLSQQSQSVSGDKEESYQKAVALNKFVRNESFQAAKKLKNLKPDWRPNTQNDKIFIKEVLTELWNKIEQLNLEKQRRDQESLMFMSNKAFIDEQVSAQNNSQSAKLALKQNLENKKNFDTAMHILDDIVTNIEEANTLFDDNVEDIQSRKFDSEKVFEHLVAFFDRIEKIKETESYRNLMNKYFSE